MKDAEEPFKGGNVVDPSAPRELSPAGVAEPTGADAPPVGLPGDVGDDDDEFEPL